MKGPLELLPFPPQEPLPLSLLRRLYLQRKSELSIEAQALPISGKTPQRAAARQEA